VFELHVTFVVHLAGVVQSLLAVDDRLHILCKLFWRLEVLEVARRLVVDDLSQKTKPQVDEAHDVERQVWSPHPQGVLDQHPRCFRLGQEDQSGQRDEASLVSYWDLPCQEVALDLGVYELAQSLRRCLGGLDAPYLVPVPLALAPSVRGDLRRAHVSQHPPRDRHERGCALVVEFKTPVVVNYGHSTP
jgi:hypothetical protein